MTSRWFDRAEIRAVYHGEVVETRCPPILVAWIDEQLRILARSAGVGGDLHDNGISHPLIVPVILKYQGRSDLLRQDWWG